jgi:amidophosphoribosyltransferase
VPQLIYQSLDDLKQACFEAIDGPTDITDFETGVFCGKYQTDVPETYFDHLTEIRNQGKKRRSAEQDGSDPKKPTLVADNFPVNQRKTQHTQPSEAEPESATSQEDIKYVCDV